MTLPVSPVLVPDLRRAHHRKLTTEQFLGELREAFGTDPMRWAFACPNCGDVATGQDVRDALTARPRTLTTGTPIVTSDLLGRECIGRTLGALRGPAEAWTGRGCDWTSWGLFRGPWEVVGADGRTRWSFPIAAIREAS